MPSDLSPPVVGIATLWAGTFVYGLNFLLFLMFVRVTVKKYSKNERIPWTLIAAIFLQFSLSTVHVSMLLAAGVRAFKESHTTAAALVANWLSIFNVFTEVQQVIYGINNLIGDLILVWRLYIVYSGNLYVVIFPLLLVLGAGACSIYSSSAIFVIASQIASEGTRASLGQYVTAAFSLTASTQILITLLIGARIYLVSEKFSSKHQNAIRIFIESGATMAIAEILFIAIWRRGLSGVSQFLLGILGQLCALVPLTIALRVGLGLAPATTVGASTATGTLKASAVLNGVKPSNMSDISDGRGSVEKIV